MDNPSYLARRGQCLSRLNQIGHLVPLDDAPPLNFGFLEIDQKANGPARGSQIVDALRDRFIGEPIYTLQLNHQHVLDEDIGKVFSDVLALVIDSKRSLGGGLHSTEDEFSE